MRWGTGKRRRTYSAIQPIECPIPTRLRLVKSTPILGYKPLRRICTPRAYSSQLTSDIADMSGHNVGRDEERTSVVAPQKRPLVQHGRVAVVRAVDCPRFADPDAAVVRGVPKEVLECRFPVFFVVTRPVREHER